MTAGYISKLSGQRVSRDAYLAEDVVYQGYFEITAKIGLLVRSHLAPGVSNHLSLEAYICALIHNEGNGLG